MKIIKLLSLFLLLGMSTNLMAQSDFFVGKWKITVKDTPQGDAILVANLSREDGKLKGYFTVGMNTEQRIEILEIEESPESIKILFSAQGHDLFMVLKKETEDALKGTSQDMFEATAVRIKP
jgi:hypothetical protein